MRFAFAVSDWAANTPHRTVSSLLRPRLKSINPVSSISLNAKNGIKATNTVAPRDNIPCTLPPPMSGKLSATLLPCKTPSITLSTM